MSMHRRTFLGTLAAATLAGAVGCRRELREITLDWAYYSPLSIVLRYQGWLEAALHGHGIQVRWLLSQGSNRSLELLSTGAADFGSTAGAAAVLSRANGNRIKGVYVSSKPEWTALVVGRDSPVAAIADLRGKKVAATKGTDPYIFLLRVLRDAGLSKDDVELVHLQHPDGRAALERGDVDAWAGLDPHMASSELEQQSRLLVRKREYNSYSFLNVREDFLRRYPGHALRVVTAYERARRWALEHGDELLALYAREAKVSDRVAERVLQRHDFQSAVPAEEHRQALAAALDILGQEGLVKAGGEADAVGALLDASLAQQVVAGA
ncbi:MAG TPA: aliphatic sulfonate ABC transporter substrate-binding protein [Haliangium sp.]|nr:aliphatic sulfonate ABC transporter substrate-binding protein [Haliangium sp.]